MKKIFYNLLLLAKSNGITVTHVNGEGCWHCEGVVNLDKKEIKEMAHSLNIPFAELATYILAHELGHAFNHQNLGYAYGRDELLAWLTAKELIFSESEETEEFQTLAKVCLSSYGVCLDSMTFNPKKTSSFCPVPWALANKLLTKI